MNIRKVLLCTDFSDHAEAALPHALWYARTFGAELHMLHAVVLHAADPANRDLDFPDLEAAYEEVRRWASGRMEAAAGRVEEAGVPVRRVEERGVAAAPVILEYARNEEMDLVVLTTHGRRGVQRMLLGSVAEEVVRTSSRPVLAVPSRSGGRRPGRVDSILVPVDFSEHAASALSHARHLADAAGARLDVLHVLERVAYPDAYMAFATPSPVEEASPDAVRDELQRMVDEAAGPDVPTQLHLAAGRPASEIPSFVASRETDLLVIASHGLTGLERVLLGSVTERVVRRSDCPVLTVKSFGASLLPDGEASGG